VIVIAPPLEVCSIHPQVDASQAQAKAALFASVTATLTIDQGRQQKGVNLKALGVLQDPSAVALPPPLRELRSTEAAQSGAKALWLQLLWAQWLWRPTVEFDQPLTTPLEALDPYTAAPLPRRDGHLSL